MVSLPELPLWKSLQQSGVAWTNWESHLCCAVTKHRNTVFGINQPNNTQIPMTYRLELLISVLINAQWAHLDTQQYWQSWSGNTSRHVESAHLTRITSTTRWCSCSCSHRSPRYCHTFPCLCLQYYPVQKVTGPGLAIRSILILNL